MGWEKAFSENIENAREEEISYNTAMSVNRALTMGTMTSVPNVGVGLTFFAYSFSVALLTADKVFTAMSLLNLLRIPFTFFPMVMILSNQYAVRKNSKLPSPIPFSSVPSVLGYIRSFVWILDSTWIEEETRDSRLGHAC